MRRLTTLLLISLASTVPAQFDVSMTATAEAYDPGLDADAYNAADVATWDADGRFASVRASSDGFAQSSFARSAHAESSFDQPTYGDATLRAMSYARSQAFNGAPDRVFYEAKTSFRLQQRLRVETLGSVGGLVDLQLYVPMHGFVAVSLLGGDAPSSASANSTVAIHDPAGTLLGESFGTLYATSETAGDGFTWDASGRWEDRAFETTVTLPFPDDFPERKGVELIGFDPVPLGKVATGSTLEFDIDYNLDTDARVLYSSAPFALVDFSGTGGFEFQAFDAAGNRSPLTVTPVPEPASLAALGAGLAGLISRRRSVQRRRR